MIVAKAQPTTLEAPLAAGDTTFTLSALLDSKGNPLSLASFGTWVVVVLIQGSITEMIQCSAIVQNADGSATLTVASDGRNIDPTTPYAGYASGEDFQAGALAIITNDPLTMSRFANFDIAGVFLQLMTFAQVPTTTGGNPINPGDLTQKAYVDALVLGTLTTLDVVVPGTSEDTGIVAGSFVYFDTGTGGWKRTNASTAATSQDVLLGIAQGAGGTAGQPIVGGVLLQGTDSHQTGLTASTLYYLSNTVGTIGTSAGTVSVVAGIAKDATHLMFAPNFNIQITAAQSAALAGQSGTAPSGSNKYEDNADTSATAAANKLVRANGSGLIDTSFLGNVAKFGGTGTDGALAITSGTTTLSCGSASYLEKNYSSISITSTANLAFSSPNNTSGTTVALRSQGAVTITTSSTHAIDMRGLGGGHGSAFVLYDSPASSSNGIGGAGGSSCGGQGNGTGWSFQNTSTGAAQSVIAPPALAPISPFLRYAPPGGNGGSGGSGGSNGFSGGSPGTGGLGGGGLYIECAGAYTFTTGAIDLSGSAGNASSHNSSGGEQGGDGGGGAGGNCLVVANSIAADTGTYTVTGGAGGTGNGTSGSAGAAGSSLRVVNNHFA